MTKSAADLLLEKELKAAFRRGADRIAKYAIMRLESIGYKGWADDIRGMLEGDEPSEYHRTDAEYADPPADKKWETHPVTAIANQALDAAALAIHQPYLKRCEVCGSTDPKVRGNLTFPGSSFSVIPCDNAAFHGEER